VRVSTRQQVLDGGIPSRVSLRAPLSLTSKDDSRLSEWINDHLQVAPVVVEDADALGRLEESVLQRLDPPLNVRSMTPTPLRARIKDLRHDRHR
jgi:hypothetical protein